MLLTVVPKSLGTTDRFLDSETRVLRKSSCLTVQKAVQNLKNTGGGDKHLGQQHIYILLYLLTGVDSNALHLKSFHAHSHLSE